MNTTNDPFGHFTQKPRTNNVRKANNFLEAFKENAANRQSESRPSQISQSEDINVAEAFEQNYSEKQEEEARFREYFASQRRAEEDRARFQAKEEEVKKQIEQLREAILKIAKSTQNLGKEVEKAAFETPVAPGTYHLNFFEKLKSTLEMIKQRIDDSASWMQTFNQRSKRTPLYWAQVKKSGTKYMLSSERFGEMAG